MLENLSDYTMKKLIILFSVLVIVSCHYFHNKQSKDNINDAQNMYEIVTDEIIDYENFYKNDTLLIKTEVTHYRDVLPVNKERWLFEYRNNQLINEKHFLYKGDSFELVYEKKIDEAMKEIIEIEDGDTVNYDQYTYNSKGELINQKSVFKTGHIQLDYEYFDYLYDEQNRIRQRRFKKNETNEITTVQYEYENSGDTTIKYSFQNGDLSFIDKWVMTSNPDTYELFSYDLPDYILYHYEKKIQIDEDNTLQIISDRNNPIDSTFIRKGKSVKRIKDYPEILYMYTYEYDGQNNLKKEIHYSTLK